MIPGDFTVRAVSARAYELRGQLFTHIPGRERVPCLVRCQDNAYRVFIKRTSGRSLIDWLRGEEWHPIEIGEDVQSPLEAVARAETILNGVTLPGTNGKRTETQEELPAGRDESTQKTIHFVWDGAMLREIADTVNWHHDRLERICYVGGVETGEAFIPTRFYKMDGQCTPAHISVDAVSKAKAVDHMDRHGLWFLGSIHSHPPGCEIPSNTDIESMERFQSRYSCCGAVVLSEEHRHLIRFYTVLHDIHISVQDPQVKEVERGRVFELERS